MQDLLPWMAPWTAWSLYLFMLSIGTVLLVRGTFLRPRSACPRCPKCRYDRTGLPGPICPECGHALQPSEDPYCSTPRRWMVVLGLVIAVSLPAFAVQRRVRVYGWTYYLRVGPLYWLVGPEVEWAHDVGGYRIEALSDRRRFSSGGARFSGSILRIRRGGKVYFEHNLMTHGVMDNVRLGTDINGNGVPDVLLQSGDTGTGSTTTAWLFELGADKAALLGSWQGYESGLLDLHGPKADRTYDLVAYDWAWDPETRWTKERVCPCSSPPRPLS